MLPEGQRTGHTSTAARRGVVERLRLHGSLTGPRGPTTPRRHPDVPRGPATPTSSRRGPGDQPQVHSGPPGPIDGHDPTTARWNIGNWSDLLGGNTGLNVPTMPPRQPDGAQGTRHATTAATRCPGVQPHPTATNRGPGDRPNLHGSQTEPRGPGLAVMAARRGQEYRPHCHMVRWGLRDRPRPHRCHARPRAPSTPQRRPDGVQGINHAPTVATRVPRK